ncbi:MAG: hypothetical protein C0391_05060 [Anaerolinea sp.]|nr:hypothetical protein [Anaerolinea sp.]
MAGKVTGLIVQRRNPNRVNVYLDGEFAFGLQRITAAWLSVGQEMSAEIIVQLKNKDESEVVYQSALRLLSYRQRTAAEITRRLQQKGYDPEKVQQVVARLHETHLLDDRKFAVDWVDDRKAFHPRSKRLMAHEMLNKGLDRQVVEQALLSVGDDTPLAEDAARKVMDRWNGLAEKEFVTRCAAYLGRKGFSAGVCYSIARKMWNELHLEVEP